ncbi:MAG: GTP-binding protein, partial [Halomonas sp.]
LGLRWHPADRLDLDQFSALLTQLPDAARIKGVVHTPDGWKQLNRAGGAFQLAATAWRQDSRLEIILPDDVALDTQALATQLKACLVEGQSTAV